MFPLMAQNLSEGNSLLDEGRYIQALKFFEEILETNPDNTEVLNGIARANRLAGDSMTAIQFYQKSFLPVYLVDR